MAVPSDISRTVEKTMIYWFYAIGSISLVVNAVTLIIIITKSVALSREVKLLAIFQQVACLSANAFLTLLFIPFFYLRMGGGYCMGVLCLFIPYEYLISVMVFLMMCMFSIFGMMIIARHQMLLPDNSIFKMKTPVRYAAYVILKAVFHIWTVVTLLTMQSDRIDQNKVLDAYVQIRWRERGLNWFLFYGPNLPHVALWTKYGFRVLVPVVCVLIVLPFAHMTRIVLRHRREITSRGTVKGMHIVYAQTIIIQGFVMFVFVGLPFIPPVISTIPYDVYRSSQTAIVIAEMVFACATLLNSIVIVSRNRIYRSSILDLFRGPSLLRRQSVSVTSFNR